MVGEAAHESGEMIQLPGGVNGLAGPPNHGQSNPRHREDVDERASAKEQQASATATGGISGRVVKSRTVEVDEKEHAPLLSSLSAPALQGSGTLTPIKAVSPISRGEDIGLVRGNKRSSSVTLGVVAREHVSTSSSPPAKDLQHPHAVAGQPRSFASGARQEEVR